MHAPTNDPFHLQQMDVCERPMVDEHGSTTPSLPGADQTRDVHDENVVPKKRYVGAMDMSMYFLFLLRILMPHSSAFCSS